MKCLKKNLNLVLNKLEANNITIYPNPSSDYLIIEGATENTSITIYSLLGKILFNKNNISTKGKIDVHFLPANNYIITVQTKEKSSCKLITIQ